MDKKCPNNPANFGRDAAGRFATGNPGGPGRKPRAVELEYLAVTQIACPPDKWRAVVEKALEQAIRGDRHAREWLRRVLLGDRAAVSLGAAEGEFDDKTLLEKFVNTVLEDPILYHLVTQGAAMRPRHTAAKRQEK